MIGTRGEVVSKPSRIRKLRMIARFGRFTVDSGRRLLLDGDRHVTVPPKAFDLLELLVRRAPNVVAKDTIAAVVWPSEAPSDASLAMAVTELRKALGDTADRPHFIRTVHRRGYAFAADVERLDQDRDASAADRGSRGSLDEAASHGSSAAPAFWLVVGHKTLPLAEGEAIVGREPTSAIWLDRPSVSRSHARLIVDGHSAWVEDLGSLNGTFVAGARITRRTTLRGGDTITFGDVSVTLGSSHAAATTPTRPLTRS
jgi:DNA-binding winged helix-turn-helix (wHTH) protein